MVQLSPLQVLRRDAFIVYRLHTESSGVVASNLLADARRSWRDEQKSVLRWLLHLKYARITHQKGVYNKGYTLMNIFEGAPCSLLRKITWSNTATK